MRVKKIHGLGALSLVLLLSACAGMQMEGKDVIKLKPTTFQALPGWQGDHVEEALAALSQSCQRILKADDQKSFGPQPFAGFYADWKAPCASLPQDPARARAFFESYFTPYEIYGDQGRDGLFTGYYVPELQQAAGAAGTPLYSRPDDLIAVNLGDFRPELKGETIMGRVQGQNLVPYYTRAEIESGVLKKQKKEMIYVDNAVDAFFLQVQGSGVVRKKDGSEMAVGYAAANGQPYYAIGKELIARGYLTPDNVSMQAIRDWLEKNPDKAKEIMDTNKSYVFFRPLDGGFLGAETVPLTPGRSMAVDRRKIPYGAPVFIDAAGVREGDARLQKLMVAQDTGGAITGAVRGDYFWGPGEAAAFNAGAMKSSGQAYILLPKTVTVPDTFLK